jgi:hypothetical protein
MIILVKSSTPTVWNVVGERRERAHNNQILGKVGRNLKGNLKQMYEKYQLTIFTCQKYEEVSWTMLRTFTVK